MYESENCILKESVAYKPTRSYQQIVGLSDQCLALGRAFLQDAQRHIDGGIPRLAAYYLYQAVVQFLRAGNMVHYGFLAEGREDLVTTYLKIRYCTKEIAALWYGDNWPNGLYSDACNLLVIKPASAIRIPSTPIC